MEIRLLGRLEAVDGRTIVLGRPSARALLARLALGAQQPVASERLVHDLWGDRLPRRPENALQVAVSRLREALGPSSWRVQSSPGHYVLHVDPRSIDLFLAEQLLAEGRVVSASDPDAALARFEYAVRLWRGVAFDEFASLPFAPPAQVRAADVYEDLVSERNALYLACGRAGDVLRDVDAALTVHGWSERLHGQKMRALAALGRRVEAIAVYDELRARLRRTFGVEPGPELQLLYEALIHEAGNQEQGAADWFKRTVHAIERTTDGDDATRARLFVALSEAQYDSGDSNWRTTLHWAIDEALRSSDPNVLASVATGVALGWPSVAGYTDTPRVAGIRRALGHAEGTARARLLAVLAVELAFVAPLKERVELADEALDIARSNADVAVLLFVLSQRFSAIWAPETLTDRNRSADEALTLAHGCNASFVRAIVAGFRAAGAIEAGDLARADSERRLVEDLAPALNTPVLEWGLPLHASWRAVIAGDLEEAERLSYEALAIADRTNRPDGRLVFVNQLAAIRWAQGRLHELRADLEDIASSLPGLVALRPWTAAAALSAGDATSARTMLDRDLETGFAAIGRTSLTLAALTLYAEIAAAANHAQAGKALYELLEPYGSQHAFTGTAYYGPVAYALGLAAQATGDTNRARQCLTRAAAAGETSHAPIFTSRARSALNALDEKRNVGDDLIGSR